MNRIFLKVRSDIYIYVYFFLASSEHIPKHKKGTWPFVTCILVGDFLALDGIEKCGAHVPKRL